MKTSVVESVVYLGKEKTRNISVCTNQNYLLANGILSHNSMLDSRARKVTHSFIRIHQPNGAEARVYRLVSDALGQQWLRGVGKLTNVRPPNWEDCKKLTCSGCDEYGKCSLVRGQYEKKKEEAFDMLRMYVRMSLENRVKVVTPYNPLGEVTVGKKKALSEDGQVTEDEINKIIDRMRQPNSKELKRSRWGKDVVADRPGR